MSYAFSNPQGQDARISADEAKQLIREHQNREAQLDTSVTVQAMAETLNLPVWQVQQMVNNMRHQPPVVGQPMPSGVWLKTQLWKWALAAVIAAGIGTGGFGTANRLGDAFSRLTPTGWTAPSANRTQSDGIYGHDEVMLGRKLGMTCIPSFSYKFKYDSFEAAANGDSKHEMSTDEAGDLSDEDRAIIQEQYTQKILDGLNRAVANTAPDWTSGEALVTVTPNFYDGGYAKAFDLTLKQNAFGPKADPAAQQALHDALLQDIKVHWDDMVSG